MNGEKPSIVCRTVKCSLTVVSILMAVNAQAASLECSDWQNKHPNWIWCDDFEDNAQLEESYFDLNRADGRLTISSMSAFGGESALRSEWTTDASEFGGVKLSFGRTPVSPKRYTDTDFDEIYWRFYTMIDSRWVGPAEKTSRITIFSGPNWSQAMIGHVWWGSDNNLTFSIDPASGVAADLSSTAPITTRYNDFSNLRWLGLDDGTSAVFSETYRERWVCVESHVKLNTPGQADGMFDLWVDGSLEAQRTQLNWRSSYTGYGLNAIFLENYSTDSPAQNQARYFDNFVVSTERIGCEGDAPVGPGNVIKVFGD